MHGITVSLSGNIKRGTHDIHSAGVAACGTPNIDHIDVDIVSLAVSTELKKRLALVYTYAQPRIGDKTFVTKSNELLKG